MGSLFLGIIVTNFINVFLLKSFEMFMMDEFIEIVIVIFLEGYLERGRSWYEGLGELGLV